MSAITEASRDLGLDGVRRYRTKVKVRIDSHDSEVPLWISDDVVSVSTGKTVKGPGQANLTVLPRVNYMNLIRPNDYINIYFNIGDGEGWTRTFFGFVDRIEETYQVAQSGQPKTQYSIMCTDFYKAFEKTQVYFNPHLSGRSDLSGEFFGTPNIGGLALMTSGVRVHGSPADCVVNLLLVLLGFGTQFILPPGYNPRFRDVFRERRAQFIQNRLGDTARAAIEEAGGFQQLQEQFRAREHGSAQDLANSGEGSTERVNSILRSYGITNTAERERILTSASAGDVNRVAALLADSKLQRHLVLSDPGRVHNEDRGTLDILQSTLPSAKSSLLDVIDIFRFVERTAIDGYHDGYTVWQQQGTLMSFVKSMSHEIINELIFDLRPVVQGGAGQGIVGQYSREPDEIDGNLDDGGGRNGILHVPAMVLREYPYATVDGVDLRGVNIGLDAGTNSSGGRIEGEIGIVYFGDIFADRVGAPGRHAVQIPNINVADRRAGRGNILATKSLDVAVIHEEEIVKTQLGRSDHEHYNLFEFYSDALLGEDQRFFMHDILPILTPIHIMRHGLRVRSLTTRFARFSLAVTDHIAAPAPVEEVEEADEEAASSVLPTVTELGAPLLGSEGARFRNAGGNRWGYRRKPGVTPPSWIFHQGVDIQAPVGTPVYAIADGEVVLSAPNGVINGYGNCIVIRHDFGGERLYSHYAHLDTRTVGPNLSVTRSSRPFERPLWSASDFPPGRSAALPIRVSKGDQIGTIGVSEARWVGDPRRFDLGSGMGPHLHFEIDRNYPPRRDAATPRIPFTEVPSGASRPEPPAGYGRSLDPVAFFTDQGADFSTLINGASTPAAEPESEPEDFVHGPEEESDGRRSREDEGVEDSTPARSPSTRNNVDNAPTRQQLIRWALLHDHWYQHNLEYVAGRVEMRGAPEIRVGYRLDIVERSMSFYVEAVNHQWQFPGKMMTVLQVTRGQRNDPYPMYVLPALDAFNPTDTQRRTSSSRLAQYFAVPDPVAVRRALVLRSSRFTDLTAGRDTGVGSEHLNETDSLDAAVLYNEAGVLANSVDPELSRYSAEDLQEDQLRISGELRYSLEALIAEAAFNEFVDNEFSGLGFSEVKDFAQLGLGAFEFEGELVELPQDQSDSETTSGTTSIDRAASLSSELDLLEDL